MARECLYIIIKDNRERLEEGYVNAQVEGALISFVCSIVHKVIMMAGTRPEASHYATILMTLRELILIPFSPSSLFFLSLSTFVTT